MNSNFKVWSAAEWSSKSHAHIDIGSAPHIAHIVNNVFGKFSMLVRSSFAAPQSTTH